MQTSFKPAALLLVVAGPVFLGAAPVCAASFDRAIEQCRDTVGRPIVWDCLDAWDMSGTLELCRLEASPRVRKCVNGAIANGDNNVHRAIAHCRQTVGRPIVEHCMSEQGRRTELEECRATASRSVRACVRGAMIAVHGYDHIHQAIRYCRQTVGRPIVRACMRNDPWADFPTCRARASPKVRACLQRIFRAL